MADLYVVQIFRVVGTSVFADASVSWATEDLYMSVLECFLSWSCRFSDMVAGTGSTLLWI